MSYLKLIANALWAGAYGSLLVALLVLYLNEDLASRGLASAGSAGVLLSCIVAYLPAIALTYPTLFILLRFFAARRLGTGWVSLKAIVWFGVATALTMAAAFYHNLWWAGSLLSPGTRESLRICCAVTAACALMALGAACAGQVRPSRAGLSWRVAVCGFLLALVVAAIGLIAATRHGAPGAPPSLLSVKAPAPAPAAGGSGLLVVGIESASMDFILPLVSARELPTFEALMSGGASSRLNSLRPCAPRVVWTVLATGLPPWSTGVTSARRYALPVSRSELDVLPRMIGARMLLRAGLITNASEQATRRAPAFWEILRAAGGSVHVIGWSDLSGPERPAEPAIRHDARVDTRVEKIAGEGARSAAGAAGGLWRILSGSVARDLAARDDALSILRADREAGRSPGLVAVKLPGLGDVSRMFLRYHLPREFGDVTPGEQAAYGKVLTGYYRFLDDLIGDLVAAAGPQIPVILVSPHGVEPTTAWERLSLRLWPETRQTDPPPSGSWRLGPDGVLLLRGEGIKAGARLEEADLIDIVPTTLYLLGLPVGRDMSGNLLRRIFEAAYLDSHPVRYIPGYAAREMMAL